ncbi:MAG: transposase [Planctomycetota bacterium]|jgi:putative transposase
MPRIARVVVPGYPHHVTQRGVRSMDVFADDDQRRYYLRAMAEECADAGVGVLSYCLMDNHTHLVMVPSTEQSLALAVGRAHKRYTRMKNFSEGVRGYLFQGRFSSCVMDERHLLAAARYGELNPVRARMVERPEDWPWSSAAFHLGKRPDDPLVTDRTLLGLVDDWAEFLARRDEAARAALRRATRTGRPAGDRRFLVRMERLTGRRLRRMKPGPRPRKKPR